MSQEKEAENYREGLVNTQNARNHGWVPTTSFSESLLRRMGHYCISDFELERDVRKSK